MAESGCAIILTIDLYSEGILNVQQFRRKHLLSKNDQSMLDDALGTLVTCKETPLVRGAHALNLQQWYFRKRGSICSGPFIV